MIYKSLEKLMEDLKIHDGLHLSFHHHLRNGDKVLNLIMEDLIAKNIKDLHLYPSGIFPVHTSMVNALKKGLIKSITTNYLNGPLSDALNQYPMEGQLTMQTHGGRARAIIEGDNQIDIAFIAVSSCDQAGNASGLYGKTACGALGYAIEDAIHAKRTVIVCDTLLDTVNNPQIEGQFVDDVLLIDSIGNASGIVSGTLAITKDPLGLKVAREAMRFLIASQFIKNNVSYQSGAGGVSLAITKMFNEYLESHHLKASFYTGGITRYHVDALEKGLVQSLYDVQCFDMEAIRSLKENPDHHFMSASDYANPNNPDRKIKALDIVILGATEIDLDFNVNVTTDSKGLIIGGSGGHSDTAEDAKLSIIVSPLLKGRMPLICKRVTTITTPGKHIDVLITERGIAINPMRKDLLELFNDSALNIMPIETLMKKAHDLSGVPKPLKKSSQSLGIVEDRHGQTSDILYRKE